MAAVAGSKGRLLPLSTRAPSPQVALIPRLLAGTDTPASASAELLEAAAIREVGIDTNMVCNLDCKYCYLSDRPEAKGDVPLEALQDRLTYLAENGAKLFAFIGKEPLADARAPTLLSRLDGLRRKGARFRTGLVTNGTLIDRWTEMLVEGDVSYVDISIDGSSDWDNRLRGHAVSARIRGGVDAILRSPLRPRFATATVLTDASVENFPRFVSAMFDQGAVTCFASPVLRFAMSNDVAACAVGLEQTLELADRLADACSVHGPDVQVILDLPYRYTWDLLRSGRVPIDQVMEDAFEAVFWQIPYSQIYLKLNPFSYSYWRALRITHDGRVILNMDLAAHPQYAVSSRDLKDVGPNLLPLMREAGGCFLQDFITRHLSKCDEPAFERGLAGQLERELRNRSYSHYN